MDHGRSQVSATLFLDKPRTELGRGLPETGVEHATAKFGPRLVEQERCGYLRPVVIHCDSPERTLANTEFMFPFVTVVRCTQDNMLKQIGSTLVGSAITNDEQFQRQLIDATHIDRLNLGPVPTIQLDWLQPHEGNIVEFLFRPRAFQSKRGSSNRPPAAAAATARSTDSLVNGGPLL